MIVTHKVSLDLVKWGLPPCIDVMQDDKYSRNLEIALYAGGVPFLPSEACSVLVRYKKSDKTGGAYDSLPDGTPAGKISDNVVTVALAPQVCTSAGNVDLVISLISGSSELNSFVLQLSVHELPTGVKSSREYINITGFIPQPGSASVGQCLIVDEVNSSGKVTAVRTAEAGGAAAISENVVTCNLDGSTEDTDITPVNADTFGGHPPAYYATAAVNDVTSDVILSENVADGRVVCTKTGKLVVVNSVFKLSASPAAYTATPIASGLPIPKSSDNFGILISDDTTYTANLEVWGDGSLYVRNSATSVGTYYWKGQVVYICNETTEEATA